ncbi:MAG: hypothetical protein R6X02_30080 [Enhygromyxa sp.]
MSRTTLLAALAGLLATTACRNALPCPDCDDEADEQDDQADEPLPDLPCGGADLMTDNLNCGTCGHECVLWYSGTEYEAGTCNQGVCGPGWTDCQSGGFPGGFSNCAEICVALGQTCVPQGCAGLTAMMYEVNFDGWGCDPTSRKPVVTMTEACDEPIPWLNNGETARHAMCCCDFQ